MKPSLIDCLIYGMSQAFTFFGITIPERESTWDRCGDEW